MTFLIAFVIFGFVGGIMVNSFMSGRSSLGAVWSVGLGVVGSFILGMLFLQFGKVLVGEGPEFIVSLLSAAVGGFIFPLIASFIKK
jgi:uncharacterized membrane protein YeaQ/YmgE (transglycosylase-associated protein family)